MRTGPASALLALFALAAPASAQLSVPPPPPPPDEGEPIVRWEGPPRGVGGHGSMPPAPYGPVHRIRGTLTYSSEGARFWERSAAARLRLDRSSDLSPADPHPDDFIGDKLSYLRS